MVDRLLAKWLAGCVVFAGLMYVFEHWQIVVFFVVVSLCFRAASGLVYACSRVLGGRKSRLQD